MTSLFPKGWKRPKTPSNVTIVINVTDSIDAKAIAADVNRRLRADQN